MTRKHVEAFAKYAGLVTVCFEWLAILLFYVFRPAAFNGENPISYFASFPETRFIFSACLTIAATSFWIFATFHLPKFYSVPVRLFATSMIGYAALALVPFDPTNATSDVVHRLLALFFSVTYFTGIYLVGKNSKNTQVRLASYATALLSAISIVAFLFTPKGSTLAFPLEAAGAFIGQVWVIWISFHSFRADPRDT